jgi:serine/threonine-protein kinase
MQRFVHELRYSCKITHLNVIRIYDFLHIAETTRSRWSTFRPDTLGGEVLDGKPLALRCAVPLGMDVAKGMTVAHQVGSCTAT